MSSVNVKALPSFALWQVSVLRADLITGINATRYRPSRKTTIGRVKTEVLIAPTESGLSVRTHNRGMDIPAAGCWTSPIAVNGAWLKRLAPKLTGDTVDISYADGEIAFNQTRLTGREV